MSLFRRPKKNMNPRMFVICDSEEDFKNLWMWCYEHNYTDDTNLSGAIKKYRHDSTKEIYEQPPMYCIDPSKDDGKLTLCKGYNEALPDHVKSAVRFQREHAVHAKDIDFDFLTPIE